MYKVFIDHKPVVFIQKNDFVENLPFINAEEVVELREDLRKFMLDIHI